MTLSPFLLSWMTAFAFTQCVEMGVYVHAHAKPRPLSERLMIAFSCSAITHPFLWFVLPDITSALGVRGWWSMVAIGETWVVIVETIVLAAFSVRYPLAWAMAANGASFLMGLFGYYYLDWA